MNLKYKNLTYLQSAVMSATFAKFHPNLVVGGTYSGQIVLWDNRSNKRTPVQRTPLSAAAHTVSKEVISIRRLCSFTIEYLVVPIRVASECVSFDVWIPYHLAAKNKGLFSVFLEICFIRNLFLFWDILLLINRIASNFTLKMPWRYETVLIWKRISMIMQ